MPPTVPPLRIGSHQIWPPLVLAPMSGVTNRTMRALYKPFGLGLTVTEFVSSNALKYGSKRTMEMIDQHGLEKPVSTQLWGDDPATMAAAALFVDSRASAAGESGDFLLALAEGAIDAGHIRAELGDVLTGSAQGRRDAREITVFESLGLAVEDLAAAAYLYREASRDGAGSWVEF